MKWKPAHIGLAAGVVLVPLSVMLGQRHGAELTDRLYGVERNGTLSLTFDEAKNRNLSDRMLEIYAKKKDVSAVTKLLTAFGCTCSESSPGAYRQWPNQIVCTITGPVPQDPAVNNKAYGPNPQAIRMIEINYGNGAMAVRTDTAMLPPKPTVVSPKV